MMSSDSATQEEQLTAQRKRKQHMYGVRKGRNIGARDKNTRQSTTKRKRVTSEAKMCQTDSKKDTHIQQQTLGIRLSQATDAAEQTGICPVHLPQHLQQSGVVTGPPMNTHSRTHSGKGS